VWDEEYVHVGAPAVAPAATYEVRAIGEAGGFSVALLVETVPRPFLKIWGDVVGQADSDTGEYSGPNGFANINDVQATLFGILEIHMPPPVTWVDVAPEIPNYILNVSDLLYVVLGVKGLDYSFIDPALYATPGPLGCEDCNINGVCDVCELENGTGHDCNDNGILDNCDIRTGFSDDCLPNTIPDECEPDCNDNGVGDDCDIRDCLPEDPSCQDCNSNGVPDGCEPGGDCNANGLPDICDMANDPVLYVDTDGDQLLDVCETNTSVFVDKSDAGSDPTNPDSDGDGISDGDEVLGTLAGLDLLALGANPNRKTLFVEMDWFDDNIDGAHSHRPSDVSVQMFVDAFAVAPVYNPDPTFPTGIELIVDYGQEAGEPDGVLTGGNLIPGGDTEVEWVTEFDEYMEAHFASNRSGYFRYGIHAHRHSFNPNSSGIAEQPGDEFMVTLQSSLSDSNVSKTMMHEFGHNLGLGHGGFEEKQYKPNYNSIMNYRYQFAGVDADCDAYGDGVLDYSDGTLPELDENYLAELDGVCGASCDPPCPIDWNFDEVVSAEVAYNINCTAGMTAPCGNHPEPACDATCDLLQDHDDWADLLYSIPQAYRAGSRTVKCRSVAPR
jgi:hypothetical protein